MKKAIGIAVVVAILGLLGMAVAQMGPGMMGYGMGPAYGAGPGYSLGYEAAPQYCPYCGGYLGPMWGRSYPMGPRMMWRYGPPAWRGGEPLKMEEARTMVEDALRFTRNPNLKVGKVKDKGDYYEAEILTKEGSLVDKVLVDKYTGYMRSIYW